MAGVSGETRMSVEALKVFPGFKFSPTDVELISYYLRNKIDGFEKCVEVIPDVDIYNFEPWDLPAKSVVRSDSEWFFFCARGRKYPRGSQNRRTTEMGYWKATGKERDVRSGSEVIGTKRTLVFHMGRAPKGERTEWIMHEYCMNGVPQDALVVCRLRRNAEFRGSLSQTQMPSEKNRNLVILENGNDQTALSERESNKGECYLSTESWQKPLSDVAEPSDNPQEPANEDLYAEILKDDIIKLDEAATFPPLLPLAAAATWDLPVEASSRVLPLPGMMDRQIKSSIQQERGYKEKNSKPSTDWSSCFVGLFPIKTENRKKWDVFFVAMALVALLIFFGPQHIKKLVFGMRLEVE